MNEQDMPMTDEDLHRRRRTDRDDERLFFIKRSTWVLMKRMAMRSIVLGVLTIMGFAVLEHLVESGRIDRLGFIHQFPELLSMMRAAAILTFIEMSVFWIRLATTPSLDVQEYAKAAMRHPLGAAIVYVTNTIHTALRVGLLVYLTGN